MDSRSLFQNRFSEVDGMESARRMTLRNPLSTNMRYTTMLGNLEEHKPVTTVSGMADMQRQDD